METDRVAVAMGDIVETPGVLSGRPRVEGTRIGVCHIVSQIETGSTIEQVAEEDYPSLSVEQVREAVEWARENPIQMRRDKLKDKLAYHEATAENLRTEIEWLGKTCPECEEHVLTKEEDIPNGVGLLTCDECGTLVTNKLDRNQASSQS